MPKVSKKKHKQAPDKIAQNSGNEAIVQLTASARRNDLIVVIGTGVSMNLTNGTIPALSWPNLIKDGFSYCVTKGKITPDQANFWNPQLSSHDLDDLLSAAEFMGRKIGAPSGDLYARWLEKTFNSTRASNSEMEKALQLLKEAGILICTLNYDSLLEDITGLPTINLGETAKVTAWMRHEQSGILHLHGSWTHPESCILGIRDYESTLGNGVRDLIQRSLASFKRLLFIGCGETFADPNFSALTKWLREKMKTGAPQHYALVRESEVGTRNADPAWHGLVEPLSFGSNYTDLPSFLSKIFKVLPSVPAVKNGASVNVPAADHERTLSDYRAFLIRDCGQMTIEGIRADMDTAQRKFDLERLFVPLTVLPCPPDIPESDPKRSEKLSKFHEKNKTPIKFGNIFKKHNRLALLALPGGGKTLLLKRLAVAYADPSRRSASADALPDMDLTPVLIRCREWREHIHRPISTLLQNIVAITGCSLLSGLSEALIPLLKSGRVLLLVDGLDEIHDDAHRSTFVEHVENFLDEYPSTHLVITSREAGFSLVAPAIARFCERWRVAPLQPDAISLLCDYWHELMGAGSPEALAEGKEVAEHLLRNAPLHRLAENPLLLTMLLVVKHGAGRLPPDRVSLYSRAVEILLDTWNIKGHEPLNPKEAVPQLAFVAFQLMRAGKQTATESELLFLLEQARDSVPQIRRYAKDTPHAFLKRVELRSSLLMEAGRQAEGGGTVPFYQFRHLTFQEYLAAVAAVEGHYIGYNKEDTVLTPLAPYVILEKWKEVIPMAAVLARKQAEPLMAVLVKEGCLLKLQMENGDQSEAKDSFEIPAPAARLVQCLAEETEAAPDTLTSALQLVAFFAKGFNNQDGFRILSRGPYGEELLHQTWLLYKTMKWPKTTSLINTYSMLAAYRRNPSHWSHSDGLTELNHLLTSTNPEEITRGLFTCAGLAWNQIRVGKGTVFNLASHPIEKIEFHIFNKDSAIAIAAAWAWTLIKYHQEPLLTPSTKVLNHLTDLWLDSKDKYLSGRAALAIFTQLGLKRSAWAPTLREPQLKKLRAMSPETFKHDDYSLAAYLVVAFHAKNVITNEDLAKLMSTARSSPIISHPNKDPIERMLQQMGPAGMQYLKSKKSKKAPR